MPPRAINPEDSKLMTRLYFLGVRTVDLAKVFDCCRTTVVLSIKRTGVALRRPKDRSAIVYRGVNYKKYYHGYYMSGHGKRLHRAVWEDNYGTIPEGHDIHHLDGDKENNDPSNLVPASSGEYVKTD